MPLKVGSGGAVLVCPFNNNKEIAFKNIMLKIYIATTYWNYMLHV